MPASPRNLIDVHSFHRTVLKLVTLYQLLEKERELHEWRFQPPKLQDNGRTPMVEHRMCQRLTVALPLLQSLADSPCSG